MVKILIKGNQTEDWDPVNEVFITHPKEKDVELRLEHSLISISEWEKKYHRSFLKALEKGDMSVEETLYYVRCMTLNSNQVPTDTYQRIRDEHMRIINNYIKDPATATVVPNKQSTGSGLNREVPTSEVIYYYMLSYGVPFDPCEKWNLNRLLKLLEVCNFKESGSQKMSRSEIYKQNAALNAARRGKYKTRG